LKQFGQINSVVTVSKFLWTVFFGRFLAIDLGFSLDLVFLMNAFQTSLTVQLGMSEKREYAISRIWHFAAYFSKVRISHILSAYFGIFHGIKYLL